MRWRCAARIWAAAVGVLVLLPAAAPSDKGPKGKQVVVHAAEVDLPGTLTLRGRNFDRGVEPLVTLGDQVLPVVSWTAAEISIDLLQPLEPGDYLLTVTTGPGSKQFDAYGLTVGPVGPVGPKGPPGETGDQGPPGSAPPHEWDDTRVRFVDPDGTWGAFRDLRGPQGPAGADSGAAFIFQQVSEGWLDGYHVSIFDASCNSGYAATALLTYNSALTVSAYPRVEGGTVRYHITVANETPAHGLYYSVGLLCQR